MYYITGMETEEMTEMSCTTQDAVLSSEPTPAVEETSQLLLTTPEAGGEGQCSSISDSCSTVTTAIPVMEDTADVAMQEESPEPASISASITEFGDGNTKVNMNPVVRLTSVDPAVPLTSVDPAVPLTSDHAVPMTSHFDQAAPLTSDDPPAPLTTDDPAAPLASDDPAAPLTSDDPAASLTSDDPAAPLTSDDSAAPLTSVDSPMPSHSPDLEMSSTSASSEQQPVSVDPATPSTSNVDMWVMCVIVKLKVGCSKFTYKQACLAH